MGCLSLAFGQNLPCTICKDKKEIAKTVAQNLTFGAIPSCMDMYTDIQLFVDYLYGTMYDKTVDTINHHYINSSQYTLNFKINLQSWSGTSWEEKYVYYNFSCFQVDTIFA